jgi:hypothetical protein
VVNRPPAEPFTSAVQGVSFSWQPVGARPFFQRARLPFASFHGLRNTTYHLEIATDEDFNHPVRDVHTWRTCAESGLLAPGNYFWRIATLDGRGLEGKWSPTGRFTIVRRLAVEMGPDRELVKHGRQLLTGPGTRFLAMAGGDETSVGSIEYSLNGGEFKAATRGVVLEQEGSHRVKARGVGRDGAVGPEQERVVVVDATAPVIDIHLGRPLREDTGSTYTVTIKAADNIKVDRIEVSLDGGPFAAYDGPIQLDAGREHTLVARAVDLVGNRSAARRLKLGALE